MEMQDCRIESVIEAANEHGYNISRECAETIVDALSASAEYASYSYRDHGISTLEEELRKELVREKSKYPCPACGGKGGKTVLVGSCHTSFERCDRCGGGGIIYP